MAAYDFSTTRLFVEPDLTTGVTLALEPAQQNYLVNVLRRTPGDGLLAFNGRHGEFRATLAGSAKKPHLLIADQERAQPPAPTLRWLFAPLKHARLDYMVQKAVEMGVGSVEPVITRHTQVTRVNQARMRANAIEAAEQCGVLSVPDVHAERPLARVLDHWDASHRLIFCDEDAELADSATMLAGLAGAPLALIIGPEGGFEASERAALLRLPGVTRLSLGPRILRADTAAVAALALIQALCGDWRRPASR